MKRRTSFINRICKITLSLLIILSVILNFAVGTFGGLNLVLKAEAESSASTADITLEAISGDPAGFNNEGYAKLFDNQSDTKWCCSFTGAACVVFKTSEPVRVQGYTITTGNDSNDYPERDPMAWTFSVSTDSLTWVEMDRIENADFPSGNYKSASFSFTQTSEFYQYFKLEITAINSGDVMQIGEVALSYTACEHQWNELGVVAPTCTNDGYTAEKCSVCNMTKVIPNAESALGHSYENKVCTRCGDEDDITPEEPTTDSNGVYQIGTAGELYWFANYVNSGNTSANAVLTEDITVNRNVLNEKGNLVDDTSEFNAWTPIGTSSNQYVGTFNGNDKTISGLYFNDTDTNYVGLFGCVKKGGNVLNVGVMDSYINGNNYVGGVCGQNRGTVTNCFNKSIVMGAENSVGGVCGENLSTITNCFNLGKVSGDNYVGGVCGSSYYYNGSTSITNCYNIGKVSGNNYVGGVCGYNSGTLTNCYYDSDKYSGDAIGLNTDSGTVDRVEGKLASAFANGDICGLVGYHSYADAHLHNGFCSFCGGGGVPARKNADGIYEISNAGQLYWFADKIKNENSTYKDLNIILTADITVNTNVLNENGKLNNGKFKEWLPIGTQNITSYTGTFDGQGHVISGLYYNNASKDSFAYSQYIGLFGYNMGTVKNVGVVDSCFYGTSGTPVGGVCGRNGGTVENCYSIALVKSTRVGGICGFNTKIITNCYHNSTVYNGEAVVSYFDNFTVTNVEGKSTEQFMSGEVCELVGFHSYFKSDTTNGSCSFCGGGYEPAYKNEDGVYEISNAGQLYWFSVQVNNGNTEMNAILTDNITVNTRVLNSKGGLNNSTFKEWTPIGDPENDYCYYGTFDGQGHTVSGLFINDSDAYYTGLFSANYGTIKNVGVVDSYFNGMYYVSGVCAGNAGTIENCYNAGTVSGEIGVAGVCVVNIDSGIMLNCYNTGKVTGTVMAENLESCVGGVCAGNIEGIIRNCYNTGEVTVINGGSDVGGVCGYSEGTIENCYYIAGTKADSFSTSKTAAQFTSGEVAYLLSQGEGGFVWGQDLNDENSYPILDATKRVYRVLVYEGCEENPGNPDIGYAYTHPAGYREHNYVNGFCEFCDGYEPAYKNDDGVYEITNAGQLYWFSVQVNNGNTKMNAILTDNITVNTNVLNENGELNNGLFREWKPIGTMSNKYTGTFDGNNKTVSGLYVYNSNITWVGFIGYNNGTIKNVGVTDSYLKGNYYVGGVCGLNSGLNSEGKITNCYNAGTLNGNNYVGGVCGYNGSTVTNCYTIGKVIGSNNAGGEVIGSNNAGVCGEDSGTITNCYYLAESEVDSIGGTTFKTADQFASGEVTYLLNGSTSEGTLVWGQDLSNENTYPILDGTKTVYLNDAYTGCVNNPGTSTYAYSNTEETIYAAHIMTKHAAKAACTQEGNYEYWTCSYEDGVYYKNEAATDRYASLDDTKIPATGHHVDADGNGKCDVCNTLICSDPADAVSVSSEAELKNAVDADAIYIMLTANIKLTSTLDLSDKILALDLNGHTLTGNINIADTSASPQSILNLLDSDPTTGGVLNGKITLTRSSGSVSHLYANGGTVTGQVSLPSYAGGIFCTSDTPTVFKGYVGNYGEIHGGIFYGSVKESCIKEKTVTFKNGDSRYALEVVASGNKVAEPIAPSVKAGYQTFDGWYNGETAYTFGSTLSESITLTAKFSNPITYNITYDLDGGTATNPTSYTVESGAITLNNPTKTGYPFIGWSGTGLTGEDNMTVTIPQGSTGNRTYTAHWQDIENPVITGLENGKTYCAAQTVTVSDNDGIASVTVNGSAVTLDANGQFTLTPAADTQTIVATDKAGNVSDEMIVTVNDGHTYEWQSENGQYWKKCKFCGDETAKKDIPTITINGADSVCVTQDYQFSFTLPQGATDPIYGYDFEVKGELGLPATIENNEPHCVVSAAWYALGKSSFEVYAGAKTADGFEFFVSKTVALLNEHIDAELKDHLCDVCGATLSEHTGGGATCIDKAICEYCGEEYGEVDNSKHNLENVPAKAATVTETGNIEYWHCKDCGKYFADENGENEIELNDTVTQKLPPEIIEGKGQTVTEGAKKELAFRSNAAFGDFIRVELDGVTVDAENYTVTEGSTIITLKADYVETLSAGEHTIGIVSTSGTAAAAFTVTDRISGDVNSDGKVDSADLLIMQNIMLGNAEFNERADFDGNGVLDAVDLLLVQLLLLGY